MKPGRRPKFNAEQHREIARRDCLYRKAKAEARKHSPEAVARELRTSLSTVKRYLGLRLVAEWDDGQTERKG